MNVSYGAVRFRNSRCSATCLDPICFRKSELAEASRTSRFARTYPKFLAKVDLPQPEKPEIHTPAPGRDDFGAAAMAENKRSYSLWIRAVAMYSLSSVKTVSGS